MINDKIENIDADLKTFFTMSNVYDMAIEILLMDVVQSKVICELGAGSCNWSGIVSKNLDERNTKFHLVENFLESEKYADIGYPTTIDDLVECSKKFMMNATLYTNDIADMPEMAEPIDVFRIDCDCGDDYESFADWILRNGSEKLIVFVDDIRLNIRPDRMWMMDELVRQGKMEFLWGGYEEAAWCRPGVVDKRKVVEIIKETYPHYYSFVNYASHCIFDSNKSYFVTRPKWTIDEPKL